MIIAGPLRPPRDLRRPRDDAAARRSRRRGAVRRHLGRRRDPARPDRSARAPRVTPGTGSSRATRPRSPWSPPRPGRDHGASSSSPASAPRSSRCATRSRRSPSASSRRSPRSGYFRAAQAPITGLEALSAPVRLILLTEQTRDVEQGRIAEHVPLAAAVRRRRLGVALVLAPVAWVLMPWLVRVVLGTALHPRHGCRADPPARGLPAARARLDEVVPGLDRQAGPADRRPRRRDRRAAPARARLRRPLGSDRSGRRRARRNRRVRRRLGRPAAAAPARASTWPPGAERAARAVKVLVVSGIWPPDVGGPASHAPDVARFLQAPRPRRRGGRDAHRRSRRPRAFPVHWTRRSLPVGSQARATRSSSSGATPAGPTSSTRPACSGAAGSRAALARRPLVVKLTGDPAFERLRARGAVGGDVDSFQDAGGRVAARALRQLSDRGAATSGARLHAERLPARARDRLGRGPERVSVMPNPAPFERPSAPRAELRTPLRFRRPDPRLRRAADGPEVARRDGRRRRRLPGRCARRRRRRRASATRSSRRRGRGLGDRVSCSARCRARTCSTLFAAADASMLSSSWENFPHSVVESLAVGTPVIATQGRRRRGGRRGRQQRPARSRGRRRRARGGGAPVLRRRGPSRRACAPHAASSVGGLPARSGCSARSRRRSRRSAR